MIKGAKTVAEFEIRKWLNKKEFAIDHFVFEMVGPREAVIKDVNGDQLRLIYNPATRMVIPMNMAGEDA